MLDAKAANISLAPAPMVPSTDPDAGPAMSGLFDTPSFLPDVPGGLVTYIVGGLLAWHYLFRKKKAA